jgi:hypothetical protein
MGRAAYLPQRSDPSLDSVLAHFENSGNASRPGAPRRRHRGRRRPGVRVGPRRLDTGQASVEGAARAARVRREFRRDRRRPRDGRATVRVERDAPARSRVEREAPAHLRAADVVQPEDADRDEGRGDRSSGRRHPQGSLVLVGGATRRSRAATSPSWRAACALRASAVSPAA